MTIELSEYVIDAIANAVAKKMQEPCEDAISRQAVLEGIAKWVEDGYADSEADISHVSSLVTHLPSVTPTRKVGKWTEHFDESGKWYECDQCHTDWGGPANYCPNCGADMREATNGN